MEGISHGSLKWECCLSTHDGGGLQPVPDCADPFVDDIVVESGTEDMTDDELIAAHEKELRRKFGILDKHSMVSSPQRPNCL